MREQERSVRDERRCETVGALAALAMPSVSETPDAAQWDRLQSALARGVGRRQRSLAWRMALAAVPLAAGALILAWAIHRPGLPPLGYAVHGAPLAADGALVAAAGATATVRFDDGSSIGLQGGSHARLSPDARTGRAELALEDGRARFAVLHRPRTRWAAVAGPFRAEASEARFEVRWSTVSRRLEAFVWEGEVHVSGGPVGDGMVLRAGDHLTAEAGAGTISLTRGAERSVDGAPATETSAPAVQRAPSQGAPVTAQERPAPRRAISGVKRTARGGGGGTSPSPGQAAANDDGVAMPPIDSAVAGVPRSAGATGIAEAARPTPSPLLAQGGEDCRAGARFPFDDALPTAVNIRAIGNPTLDHERSWCGAGSMSALLSFSLAGPRNSRNQILSQAGEYHVVLPAPVDLTNRTVTAHVYVEADPSVRYGAAIIALNGGTPVDGGRVTNVSPGHWVTLTQTYASENRIWLGGTSPVNAVHVLGVIVWAESNVRVWTGRVWVDELDIR